MIASLQPHGGVDNYQGSPQGKHADSDGIEVYGGRDGDEHTIVRDNPLPFEKINGGCHFLMKLPTCHHLMTDMLQVWRDSWLKSAPLVTLPLQDLTNQAIQYTTMS